MLVSVIISTYNSRQFLPQALDALAAQTLDPEQLEVLVVDDGSTDDTWSFLSAVAAERDNVSIFSQPNSGGASRGRNRGLAMARGRYVFFHDADDYLGVEALDRLTAAAEAEGADVVVGHVRRFGLATPHRPSNRTVLDADLVDDGVWRSLSPHKLFRRTLTERLGVTFPEDQVFGEDQVFVATCLFAAAKVSMLGDYDFYHRRSREDHGNLSTSVPQTLINKQLTVCRMTRLVVANTEPGRRRDALLRRVLLGTLVGGLHTIFAEASAPDREAFLAAIRSEVLPHLSDRLLRVATPTARLRLLTARDGTAEQLLALKPILERPWRHRVDDGLLCYELGPDLDALIPAPDRRVSESFPVEHEILAVDPTRSGLGVRLRLGPGPVPYDRLVLQARTRGESWVMLAEQPNPTPETRLQIDRPEADGEQRWALRLLGCAHGAVVASSPLTWPADHDRLPAARRRSVVGVGRARRLLKLYADADGHARLFLR